MIYQFTSSKVVIARVGRFINGSSWISISAMYLGDGIQELGYASKRKNKVESKSLIVENHKAEIPCDLEILEYVYYNGCRLPLNRDSRMLALTCDDYVWDNQGANWYDIEVPYIRTSFESGKIEITYRGFEYDIDGYIMIPDLVSYREALVWYMLKNLVLEGYALKDQRIDFNYCEQMFDKYKRKAKSQVKKFSRDQREQFARMWNSTNINFVESNLFN
jgi:hypothetical protein